MDRRLSPRYFLNDEPLVSTRNQLICGDDVQPGGLISHDLEYGIRLKLWMSGRAKYRKDYSPSAVADEPSGDAGPGEIKLSEVGSNGYYEINAPWFDEPIRVRGKNKAEAMLAKLQREAKPETGEQPEGHDDGQAEDQDAADQAGDDTPAGNADEPSGDAPEE